MRTDEHRDFDQYVDAWRERLARQQSEQHLRAQRLREVARSCARLLVQGFGARKVYLFGSLLDQDLVHDRSDIDLAVEGLEGKLYFTALRDACRLLPPGIELDLVPLEQARLGLAGRVRTEGVLLDAAA